MRAQALLTYAIHVRKALHQSSTGRGGPSGFVTAQNIMQRPKGLAAAAAPALDWDDDVFIKAVRRNPIPATSFHYNSCCCFCDEDCPYRQLASCHRKCEDCTPKIPGRPL